MLDMEIAKQVVSLCEYVKEKTSDILEFMETTELTKGVETTYLFSSQIKEISYFENGDKYSHFSIIFKKNGEVESIHLSSPYIKRVFHLESIDRFDCISINDKKAEIMVLTPASTSTIYMDFRKRKIEVY